MSFTGADFCLDSERGVIRLVYWLLRERAIVIGKCTNSFFMISINVLESCCVAERYYCIIEIDYRIVGSSIDCFESQKSIEYDYIRSQNESNNVYNNMTQLKKDQIKVVNKNNNSKHK